MSGINEAISTLASDAWEGLDRRPNWRGSATGTISERRTVARFKKIRDVLEIGGGEGS